MRDNFFKVSSGDRNGVQNFMVIFTNGASDVPAAVAEVGVLKGFWRVLGDFGGFWGILGGFQEPLKVF